MKLSCTFFNQVDRGNRVLLLLLLSLFTLPALAQKTWTGATSTDWNTPANWAGGTIPLVTDDVVIPSAPTNQPLLSTAAVAKSVEVQGGASLSITAAGSLTINGSKDIGNFTIAFFNRGSILNAGRVILGSVASVGNAAIFNEATFDNKTGGYIQIDQSTQYGIFNNGSGASFTNSATITIGSLFSVGTSGIYNLGGTFANNAPGTVKIDRTAAQAINNFSRGTITNTGTLIVGSVASVGNQGIYNQATFNNQRGSIQIDQSTQCGILNSGGGTTFTNSATLTIGSSFTVGLDGIRNEASFTNNTEGSIQIDRATSSGLANVGSGSNFSNAGQLIIGASASVGNDGIANQGTFTNGGSGVIQINRSAQAGIRNSGSGASFTNSAAIIIGSSFSVGLDGIRNEATFNNNQGGVIQIDRSTSSGLANLGSGSNFSNAGQLIIGASASVRNQGIYNANQGTFNNNQGGTIQIDQSSRYGIWNNGSVVSFTNSATITIGSSFSVGISGIYNQGGSFTNNASGTVKIDRTGTQAINNFAEGTVTNSGHLILGSAASVGNQGIFNQAAFNNNAGGSIQIDRSNQVAILNSGSGVTFTNSASITIGSSFSVGNTGIRNGATFDNNQGGILQIDRSTNAGILNVGSGATFTNSASITIGSSFSVGTYGVSNDNNATFRNEVGGNVSINRATSFGITNNIGASFTNSATIVVGNIAFSGQDGIQNQADFTNTATGDITVDRATGNGIFHVSGTFQNAGAIRIGSVANSGLSGLLSYSALTNTSSGVIQIDRVRDGIVSTSTFINAGQIRIGTTGSITRDGLVNTNTGTFSNSACATLTLFDNLNNQGSFTNEGLFTVRTTQPHTNTATLTNNGIIEYPLGNPIPNVTNNDLIALPVSSCGSSISPALQVGGSNSFQVATTWYRDPGLTQPAGSYDGASNTFTPSNLGGGSIVYFAATDATNNCTKTVSLSVGAGAGVTASIAPASATLTCASPTVSLTASGGQSYRWDDGSTNPVRTVSAAGTYSVVVTGASGCTATATTTVQSATNAVNATLVASGSISCASPSVTLTATPTGQASYVFSAGATQLGGSSGNIATVTTAGVYSVVITSANGCSAVATVTVTGSTTAPAASLVASGSISCNSPSVTLTASPGGASYAFSAGATPIGSTNQATVTQAGTYSVIVTGANGCTASASVVVGGNTTAPVVSLVANGTLTCASPSVTLTASPVGQASYVFSAGASQIGSTNQAVVTAGGTYSVVVTGANGCTGSATTTVQSATNAVNASLVASGSITCNSPSVTLTASPTGQASYAFRGPGLDQSGPTNTATVTQAGTYSVVVTGAGGCSALATASLQSNTALPPLTISALPAATLTQGQPLTLSATTNQPLTFQWNTGQTTPTINPPTNQVGTFTYSLTATAPNGCSATASLTLLVSPLCGSPTNTIGGPLALLEPLYDCQSGLLRFRTTGGDGTPITYSAIGITGPTQSCSALVDAELAADIRNQKPSVQPLTLFATQGNVTVSYSWNALATCAGQGGNGSPRVQQPVLPQSATVGVGYSLALSGVFTDIETPGQLTLSVRGLPPGLQLAGESIVGTPSLAGVSSVSLTATDPGGLSTSTLFSVTVSPAVGNTGVGGPLSATVVSYHCTTGAITFGSVGGNGSVVEYFAIGVTGWTSTPQQTIEPDLRSDPRPVTVRVRQGGMEGQPFVFDFGAFCANPGGNQAPIAPVVGPQSATVGTAFSLTVPPFTDPNGDVLTYAADGLGASGLSFDAGSRTISGTPSASGVVTVRVRATDPAGLSASVSFAITISAGGGGTPPVGGPLSATVVSYNCQTGAIVFGSVGGNGSVVEYFAIGVTGWTTNPSQTIEAGLRADPKPIYVRVRQSGMEGQGYTFDFGAYCAGRARRSQESASELSVRVLGNPVAGDRVAVETTGATEQALQLELVDINGQVIDQLRIAKAKPTELVWLKLGREGGVYVVRVRGGSQQQSLRVIRQ